MAERIKEYLATEFGITTEEELLSAIEADKGVPVGMFVNRIGGKGSANKAI